ncbi:hypothetical protein D3C81_1385140 [compost metagenome]
MVDVGDIRLIRIPIPKRDSRFGAVDQRKVKARLKGPGEWLGQPQRHAFPTAGPVFEIEVKTDGVITLLGQVGVGILARGGNARAERALNLRPVGFIQR